MLATGFYFQMYGYSYIILLFYSSEVYSLTIAALYSRNMLLL
jgi:hypothetical protein